MANDVATVAFRSMIDSYLALCRQRGQAPANLCNALPFDHASVDAVPYRDWHTWTLFLDNLDVATRSLCTLDELEREWSQHTPSLGPFRRVLALFVSPEQVLHGVWNWSGPRMFRPMRPTYKKVGPDLVRLTLSLPHGFTPSRLYFRFSALATARLPMLLGLAAAEVMREDVSSIHLDLTLKLPASRSIFSSIARMVRPRSSKILSEALVSSHLEHRHDLATLESLVNESLDGVLIERNGGILSMNKAARGILGLGPHDDPGVELAQLILSDDKLDAGVGPRLLRLLQGTDAERWVQVWTSRSLVEGDGRRITFVRDVTDSEVLRRQFERLQRYAAIGETGAILGHEITTSLAAMLSDLQWCLEDDKSGIASDVTRRTLERTQNNARHLVNVARNLLSPAKSDTPAAAVYDLGPIVRQAADIASYVAKGSGVQLRAKIPAISVQSFCRANDVLQILVNLLTNAIEAARISNRREVNVYLTDHPPLVEVHDHGSGLPDDLEASWGEIQSTRRPGGHGLGLLISKRLAKKNAATLSYERLPHGTTVFGLKLPNPPA